MPLPVTTSRFDPESNSQVPSNTGTWANLSSWSSWTGWSNQPATSFTVVGTPQDRGTTGWFNLKTNIDATGEIEYCIVTSNSGAFAGEETYTVIQPNTGNLSAFYGRYYSVVANVSDTAGGGQLRSLVSTSTNSRFDIEFNDLDTSTLAEGAAGTRILPLPRTVSALLNMQVTSHNPTQENAVYITTGNTGYVLDYTASVQTTLSSAVSIAPAFTQYMAMAADGESPNVQVYKTTNGTSWASLGNVIANSVQGTASSITWSYNGGILVFATESTLGGGLEYNYIRGYSRSGDTFTKLADPDVWPTGAVNDVAWARTDDDYCAVAHDNSPYLTLYKKSGVNYVKESNPATLPTGNGQSLAWTADDAFLAVGHAASPYVTVYSRSGNTFTKLANPSSLPTAAVYDLSWDPTGRWLICSVGAANPTIKIYYRAGTTSSSTLVAIANPAVVPVLSTGVFALDWNSSGNAVAIAWSGNLTTANVAGPHWGVYRVNGNTFSWANTVSTLDRTVQDIDWGPGDNQIYVSYSGTAGTGVETYDFDQATNVATPITGLVSTVGNVLATSTYFVQYNNWIEVANAAPFVGSPGNIRVRNETMSFTTANVTPTPNRLEGITRAVTTTTFGNSTANTHATGSEVSLISSIDFSARYFATQAVGISNAYVGDKNRISPTVIVRDGDGNYTDGTVDAVVWVLPEQYMDDQNLSTR